MVYAILEGADGTLWLSTNRGIANYDPTSGGIRTFTAGDGLLRSILDQVRVLKGVDRACFLVRDRATQRFRIQVSAGWDENRTDGLELSEDEVVSLYLSNAIKYTHSGGSVRLSCETRGDHVVTSVSDTGQGLGPDDLEHVFHSFKRLSAQPTGGEPSTGLGLAIAKSIVELHGGRIWVTSVQGKGSIFSFSLPVANRPARP